MDQLIPEVYSSRPLFPPHPDVRECHARHIEPRAPSSRPMQGVRTGLERAAPADSRQANDRAWLELPALDVVRQLACGRELGEARRLFVGRERLRAGRPRDSGTLSRLPPRVRPRPWVPPGTPQPAARPELDDCAEYGRAAKAEHGGAKRKQGRKDGRPTPRAGASTTAGPLPPRSLAVGRRARPMPKGRRLRTQRRWDARDPRRS